MGEKTSLSLSGCCMADSREHSRLANPKGRATSCINEEMVVSPMVVHPKSLPVLGALRGGELGGTWGLPGPAFVFFPC